MPMSSKHPNSGEVHKPGAAPPGGGALIITDVQLIMLFFYQYKLEYCELRLQTTDKRSNRLSKITAGKNTENTDNW